ncbi:MULTISPECIES: condensation domain-containing protein [unclassified Microcoleus]|uniref:condensation domain-containing protein n=1 Tax=unclassified Microcoleus TaxID=2642155 RepID=UPI002FD27A35
MTSFSRKLGLVEMWMALGNEVGGGLIVNVVYLEGILKAELVQQALKLVQQRHPMLQVYIVESEDGLYFQSTGITEIPVQVIYKQDENEAIKIAEKELHTKFTPGNNPLCRLTLLYSHQHQNSCEVIITFHHGIVDGISCMRFIDDLLFYYQEINEGENISQVESLEFIPPIETIVNYNIPSQNPRENHQLANEQPSLPPQLIIEHQASANERLTRMLPRMLSQEKTKTLIDKCKQEKTTVHGAMCAAMLFAAGKLLSIDTQVNCSYGLPVDLRKYCEPEITGQNLGCFISALGFNQLIEPKTSFWDLARECKCRIHDSLISGVHITRLLQGKLRNLDIDTMKKIVIKSMVSKEDTMGRNNLFSISNRGKFQFRHQADKLKVKELYFATPQHIAGDCFWLGVLTLNDQLFCNFIYVQPVISAGTAQLFADDVMTVIEKVCINQNSTLTMWCESVTQN